jgi:leucyl aminopeptidase
MKIEFGAGEPHAKAGEGLAVLAFEGGALSSAADAVDAALQGAIRRAIERSRFTGAMGTTLDLLAPHGLDADRVLVLGAGKRESWSARAAELAAAHAYQALKASGAQTLVLSLPDASADEAAHAALGVRLAAYRFERHRTNEAADKKPSLEAARIVCARRAAARRRFKSLSGLAEATEFARDLVSEPSNILYPAEFARRVKAMARLDLEVEVLGETQMRKLGMHALLGVGQGSARDSQLAIIQWKGATDLSAAPIAFVGKGVCFDAGGISLKPSAGMEHMVTDMGGAAAVAGAMHVLAARKAKVNAVGILGLVENMPDGAAQRPGDVVRTISGQTVEVIDTDAEGRLVLADALWYCQDRFRPRAIIDLATLTGGAALGLDIGGLFSNDDTLADNLLAAAKASDEALWRMPLAGQYERTLKSRVADVKNVGDAYAGAITAALFLQRFVNGAPWAHLDIPGPVWKTRSTTPTIPDGATGYGVRLLDTLVAQSYEG